MSDLQRTIAELAQQFATQVLRAIRTASLDDIASVAGGVPARARVSAPAAAAPTRAAAGARRGAGGRRRRTQGDLAALGSRIVELLKGNPEGMRAEAIREALGVPRKELPRVFNQLVEGGALRKEGQKRATTYFVKDESAVSAPAKRGGAKRGGKRGAKKAGRRKKSA
ncbi:MAG: hypothetical protein HYV09_00185 [Deltaproteobacteria bacterium]|nr:hypothetical protein [Deltaproteobacteria bacterium]